MKNAPIAAIVMAGIVAGVVWRAAETVYSQHIETVEAEYQLCQEKSGELKSTNQYMSYSNFTLKTQVPPLVQALSQAAASYRMQDDAIQSRWFTVVQDHTKTEQERNDAFYQMTEADNRRDIIENQVYDTQYKAHALLLNEALRSRFSYAALKELRTRALPYGIDVDAYGQFIGRKFQGVADQLELLNTALPEEGPRPFWSFLRKNDYYMVFLFGVVVGLLLSMFIAALRARRRSESRIVIASH
jgi:hypothetical protein